ncbi:DUF2505 domain-containing protein [Photobacterium sp. TY1-4]|uniref:DUF2505 domain-containing protein n=1 Tax=Photobacterium sp. TY1-4 TaxID=2899122 RepID=UPI0021C1FA91|nr:DUF2505 domain-containing protein [Photobacterium sp. TY1-4]UXI02703.1 DUF2505 domain-containing protein [Photobacterium sp. TY1-4]
MQVTTIHEYKEDLDTLLRYFSEEALILEKYQQLGARNIQVLKIEETEDGFSIETQREVPANVPGVLKRFLGSFNTVRQTESWHWQENEQLLCDIEVELIGVPASVSGRMLLSEPGDTPGISTRNDVSMTVTSAVPLVGSTLVSFICDDIKQQMQSEYQFLCDKLPQLETEE